MNGTPNKISGRLENEIVFIAEQDGQVECLLKAHWLPILADHESALRAYLAIVKYSQSGDTGRALCIRCIETGNGAPALVARLAEVFARMFRADCALDIMLLDGERESRLKQVCMPFFERPRKWGS